MPTYEDLRSYFDGSDTLQGVTRQAAQVPIVTGFTIDVHPLWALLYDFEEGLFGPDISGDAWVYRFLRDIPLSPMWSFTDWPVPIFQGYRRRDLKRKVARWPDC